MFLALKRLKKLFFYLPDILLNINPNPTNLDFEEHYYFIITELSKF